MVVGADHLTGIAAPDEVMAAEQIRLLSRQFPLALGEVGETAGEVKPVGAQGFRRASRHAGAAVDTVGGWDGGRWERQIGKDGGQEEPASPGGQNDQAIFSPEAQARQSGGLPLRKGRVIHKWNKFVERMGAMQGGAHRLQPPGQSGVVVLSPGVEGEVSGGLSGIVGKGGHVYSGGGGTESFRPRLSMLLHVEVQIGVGTGPPGRCSGRGPKGIKIQVKHLLKGGRRYVVPHLPQGKKRYRR